MPVAKRKSASSSLESTRVWNQLKQCLLHPTLSLPLAVRLSHFIVCLICSSFGFQVKFRVPLPPGVSSTTLLPKLIRTKDVKQLQDGNAQPTKPKLTVSNPIHTIPRTPIPSLPVSPFPPYPLYPLYHTQVQSETQLAINYIASCRNVSIHSISPRWASAPAAAPACTWSPAWWPNEWPDPVWLLVLL